MNKWVIISTNNNPDYYKYIPYVRFAWNKLGWKTITITNGISMPSDDNNKSFRIELDDYRTETIVQVSRLLGWNYDCIDDNDIVMTADGDMIPCCDYWKPINGEITTYGHDLTDYNHYPICYIAMNKKRWRDIIDCNSLNELLSYYPKAKSDIWEEWWQVDQDIITEKLSQYRSEIKSIDRGKDSIFGFLAKGRLDRYNWEMTKDINGIDAHMPRPFNKQAADFVLKKYYGEILE